MPMTDYVAVRSQEELVQRAVEAVSRDPLMIEATEYMELMTPPSLMSFLERASSDLGTLNLNEFLKKAVAYPLTDESSVNEFAKAYIPTWKKAILESKVELSGACLLRNIAWKWILGHKDADTFPGSFKSGRKGGILFKASFWYIHDQIKYGEWDKLTEKARNGS